MSSSLGVLSYAFLTSEAATRIKALSLIQRILTFSSGMSKPFHQTLQKDTHRDYTSLSERLEAKSKMLVSLTPNLDAVSRHGSGIHHRATVFDPEAQTRREYTEDSIIPWPGDDGQGNMPSPSASGTSVHERLPDVAFR
jgi:hypothetical protein